MSALTLTLFEHERVEFDWTERDLVALERLRAAAGAEVLRATFMGTRRALQATHHVGVVRLGRRAVQVLPKVYRATAAGGGDGREHEATLNLLHLLSYASGLRFSEHALAPLLRRGGDWFEILTRLFAAHLLEEWQRGAHRHYLPVEDVVPALKGKWLVGETLRQPARAHLFPVSYDEFTADNALNRVFRFTVERLWRETRDADNRRLLGELRQWMEEVSVPPRLSAHDAAPALVTRLNRRFEPLLNLARLFLAGGSLQLSAADFETYAFAFDMNSLFEGFVAGFIHRHREQVLPTPLHGCELLTQSAGAPLHLARDGRGRPAFRLRPDLAFRRGPSFPLLVDTKYKRLDPVDRKLGIAPGDFYQMHAYARRFKCPRVLLLYPQTSEMSGPLRARFTLEDDSATIEAATIELRIDLGSPAGREELAAELRRILTPLTD